MCTSNDKTMESFINIFLKKYNEQFGFTLLDRPIIVDDVRVRTLAKSAMNIDRKIDIRPKDKSLQALKVSTLCKMLSIL